nr:cysteine--tRNA ligase [Acidimicrobiia bacterium]
MLRLFDTAAGEVRPLELREPGKVSMYVCGPTVYGPPHLGHGRFSIVFDVLRRYLAWSGLDVTYVSNVTDIDDKIIARAAREDRAWTTIAERCETIWYRAMDGIGVQRPDHDPHATAYVEAMIALIDRLVEAGAAYPVADGVYFRAERVEGYGLLAARAWSRCGREPGWSSTRPRSRRSTSPCGSWPSPASRRGRRRGARVARAGTP